MNPDREMADPRLLDELTTLVSRAAKAVMRIAASSLATREKADATPVTAADEASQAVLFEGLARLVPGMPVVSEEAVAQAPRPGSTFVLIDPVDGTRELVAGRDEFAINLAILTQSRPLVGLIAAPARHLIWRGIVGHGAERLNLAPGAAASQARDRVAIRTRKAQRARLVAMVSRSHLDAQTEAFLTRFPNTERVACGSALKFCRIAEGSADLYPRLAPTHEWDVAAGDALVTAAGGKVTAMDGTPLGYGRADQEFRISDFIAWGDPALIVPATH